MLDIKLIRQDPDLVQQALARRGADASVLDNFFQHDTSRRELLAEIEELRHQRNVASDDIARKKKNKEDADEQITQMRQVSTTIKGLDEKLTLVDQELSTILMGLPNLPHASVPEGREEADNICIKEQGDLPEFDFTPAPHEDLGEALGILDFPRAAKIAGARFPLYLGAGARLVRALSSFMLDIQTEEHGYKECLPPFLVNSKTMTGTGQLPKFEEDLFKIDNWDYYLIPTAEVPVTNIYQDEVLSADQLPLKYTACTPCFRSEAGSYGKDTKGLIRQHQFNKVELVKFVHPDNSYDELEKLLADAETILQRLGLPYRVVTLCAGDIGFSAAKTYDIEVWFPAQNKYREISSCSNFEDFQARRANIRFKTPGQKGTAFVHTLNGSALAVGRTLAALLENGQQPDGSILLPEELVPYMNGLEKISL